MLGFPDYAFILEVDSSYQGIGVMHYQIQDGKRRVFAYASRTLRPSERNTESSLKLELLSNRWTMTEKFRSYLLGSEVEIYANNIGLTL